MTRKTRCNLEVRIDPEFRAMIPVLRQEERQLLEQSIVQEGCRDPLTAWKVDKDHILLDGHHRYDICQEHGVPYTATVLDRRHIPDRRAAADWIDSNQLGRRNLTKDQFALLLGRRYNRQKKPHGGRRRSSGHSDHLKTAQRLAQEHGVSEATVRRAGTFAAAIDKLKDADPSLERRIINGQGPSRTTVTHAARLCEGKPEDADTLSPDHNVPGSRKRHRLDLFYSSATPEWNTPCHVIDSVLAVLGSIDLDPCSNSQAGPNVPANRHYTKEQDGLSQAWTGRVYMNPPYGRELAFWVRKLIDAYQARCVCEAIALLPARTDTQWFRALHLYPKCFVTGRLKFGDARNSAPFPSMVVYLGNRPRHFAEAFLPMGDIYTCLSNGQERSHKE
ncbi:MAG TPA: DNA N-6-adenine-methyltransferase [Sedimentisphaerales bacterium]|jgi:hypothetical protein|nr:DNA N-6-adenine-methyltransferase [Sedimentisphaerales bacterium]HNU30959.1 DNA N-6-adenine-methyltransferase [Sedimentisphaerales bacterium]